MNTRISRGHKTDRKFNRPFPVHEYARLCDAIAENDT